MFTGLFNAGTAGSPLSKKGMSCAWEVRKSPEVRSAVARLAGLIVDCSCDFTLEISCWNVVALKESYEITSPARDLQGIDPASSLAAGMEGIKLRKLLHKKARGILVPASSVHYDQRQLL